MSAWGDFMMLHHVRVNMTVLAMQSLVHLNPTSERWKVTKMMWQTTTDGRIVWLSGLQVGIRKIPDVDTCG